MAKFFLVLTILAAGAAAYFGWTTYQKIGEVKTDLGNTKKELANTKSELVKTQLTLKDTQDQLAATKTQLDTANATIATDKTTIDGLNTQVTGLQGQVADLTDKLSKETALYEAAKGGSAAPAPGTPEEQFTKQINDLKAELQEAKLNNDTLTKKAAEAEAHAKELQDKEAHRLAKVAQPGLEGIVMAVNQGWNFAVVSLGDKQGAVPNAEVIVERDGRQIARLKITTVEPATSIADIIPDSLAKGQRVLPGDKVIFTGPPSDQPAGATQPATTQPPTTQPAPPLPQ